MANITHCDKCNAIVETGFDHHVTLRFLNPLGPNKEGFVTDAWQADFCFDCIQKIFYEYFGHLSNRIKIEDYFVKLKGSPSEVGSEERE